MRAEPVLLDAAIWLYLGAGVIAVVLSDARALRDRAVMTLLALGLILHTASIALRWQWHGHGPYVDLFEILSSNVWSLHLILLLVCLAYRPARSALPTALPVLSILTLWLMVTPAKDTVVPVTYNTVWLPVHLVLGKIFLGLVVVAVGLSLVVILRRFAGRMFAAQPASPVIEQTAHRIMLLAVVFQTLMLIAGAAWARDAWGRYWAWDPLESWAFLTWVAMLAYLHWRPRNQGLVTANSLLVVGVYVIAFFTFFGVPFISTAPHKGAV